MNPKEGDTIYFRNETDRHIMKGTVLKLEEEHVIVQCPGRPWLPVERKQIASLTPAQNS